MTSDSTIYNVLNASTHSTDSAANPLVFLVGAGISKPSPSNVPAFADFNQSVLSALTGENIAGRIGYDPEKLKLLATAIRPEVLMQLVVEEFGEHGLEFYAWLEGAEPNANHQFLAAALRNGHHVVTTNVDCLIEAAFGEKKPLKLVVTDQDYQELDIPAVVRKGAPGRLFKLHGTIDIHAPADAPPQVRYGSIRLALDAVAQGIQNAPARLLSALLGERDLIVIGYSGRDDFSVQPHLLASKTDRKLHWTRFDPATPSLALRPGNCQTWNDDNAHDRRRFSGSKIDYDKIEWEWYSIRENLTARRNGHAFLYEGHSSRTIHGIMRKTYEGEKENPGLRPPPWTEVVPESRRLVFLARVFEAARDPVHARVAAEAALYDSSDRSASQGESAKAILARLALIKGDRAAKVAAVEARRENVAAATNRSLVDQIQARLNLVNALRRNGESAEAWQELETIRELVEAKGDAEKDRLPGSILRPLYSQRGLVWYELVKRGLAPPPINDEQAFESLRLGLRHAGRNPREKAHALNSLGLVLNARAQGDEVLLLEADASIEEAFRTNLLLGNWHGCYQNCRNHAWVKHNLSKIEGSKATALRLSVESLELNHNAGAFAFKLGREAAAGELATVERDRKVFLEWHNSMLEL